MRNIVIIAAIITLSACTTPKVMLKNPKTGQIESCGGSATGSMVGGVLGYHIQKSNDSQCEADLLANGFERMASPTPAPTPEQVKKK